MKQSFSPRGCSFKRVWFLTACLALWANCATAQSYTIDWYNVSGGGGTSTGGVFAVSGTVGQHDAGGPMNGGNYSIVGGFWAGVATVTIPGAPLLTITRSANNVTVSWPSSDTVFHLQQNTNPANPAGWVACGGKVNTSNGMNNVTFAPAVGTLFLRLCSP